MSYATDGGALPEPIVVKPAHPAVGSPLSSLRSHVPAALDFLNGNSGPLSLCGLLLAGGAADEAVRTAGPDDGGEGLEVDDEIPPRSPKKTAYYVRLGHCREKRYPSQRGVVKHEAGPTMAAAQELLRGSLRQSLKPAPEIQAEALMELVMSNKGNGTWAVAVARTGI